MKVSLSRKIHIIALPQATLLKVSRSADQSCTKPRRPALSVLMWLLPCVLEVI
jgi:hypothetical protein